MEPSKANDILNWLKVPKGKKFEILLYCPQCKWKKYDDYSVLQFCETCGNVIRVIRADEIN